MTYHQQPMASSSVDVWVLTSRSFDGQVGWELLVGRSLELNQEIQEI